MKFYRVIKKDTDCDVILAVFIEMLVADEYCSFIKKQIPSGEFYIDTIKSGIELSKSFIGKVYDTI